MDKFDKWIAVVSVIFILLLIVATTTLFYGIVTGKISAEEIDTDNIWFWLFLLK